MEENMYGWSDKIFSWNEDIWEITNSFSGKKNMVMQLEKYKTWKCTGYSNESTNRKSVQQQN